MSKIQTRSRHQSNKRSKSRGKAIIKWTIAKKSLILANILDNSWPISGGDGLRIDVFILLFSQNNVSNYGFGVKEHLNYLYFIYILLYKDYYHKLKF